MSAATIGCIVFALVFGGAVLGMVLRTALPEHHLREDSKEVVKLAMGVVATTAALVLGLLIASAKNSYDEQNAEVKASAANAVVLDRTLASYGPETKEARALIRHAVADRLETIWPETGAPAAPLDAEVPPIERVEQTIRELSPRSEAQRWLQSRALQIAGDLQQTRWLLVGAIGDSIPTPFLVVLVFWLTMLFGSFGLFAPRNATVVAALFICAVSVSGSVFLVVEMERPFEGLVRIPSTPVRYALAHLGK